MSTSAGAGQQPLPTCAPVDVDAAPATGLVRGSVLRSEAHVDLDAIAANVGVLRERSGAEVMAVVKADGYGHGLVPAARAALAGGATWLGAAVVEEALALRAAGLTAPVLTWLAAPGEGWDAALAAGVDVSAGAPWLVEEVAAAARRLGRPARLHLEADTGLSRGGATADGWQALLAAARAAEEAGALRVVGVWSHFACSDEPGHPVNAAQLAAFHQRLADVERAGLRPQVRHLANSGGALLIPGAGFDLVRAGIAVYGVSPTGEVDPRDLGLRPAMTLRGRLAHVKRVTAGHGVSYGHSEVLERDTTLGIVPLGYGDGLPRQASSRAEVLVRGRRRRVVGRVCMDQVVVDLGDDVPGVDVGPGDEVLLFGPGDAGEPQAEDWARAAGTIGYEIVTRIGGRVPRTYAGALVDAGTVPARAGGVPQGAGE